MTIRKPGKGQQRLWTERALMDGDGCLADQLFGQQLAHLSGLGYVMKEEHVKSAVKAIYDHDFKSTLRGHCNLQRTYALNGDFVFLWFNKISGIKR